MNVIAFRPRPSHPGTSPRGDDGTMIRGTFRSPRGRSGQMTGSVRLQRLVLVPRGAFITGVFTGELHEPDGALIGVDSRRATTPADLVRDETGLHPQVRAFRLELMGIPVEISSFAIETTLAFPRGESASGERPPGAVPDRHLRVLPDRAAKAPSDGPVTALPDSPAPVEAALPDGLLRVLPDRPGQVQS